ncbi:MAG TPA: molybdopterin cofactor-binding domain-containing protein, partial [Ideonella sp.]|nr:molybdopterin cofactor-binding domain-containing protein [Ideonella sp.]
MIRRRALLWSGLGAAGALVVGWSGLPPRSRLGGADTLPPVAGEVGLNGWIKIAADGGVRLAMPYCEMGQGVHTALATLVAEELDVAVERVQVIAAPVDTLYGNVATLVAQLPAHPRNIEPGHETLAVRLGEWMLRKVARELGIVVTGGSSTVADSYDVLRLAAATARAQLLGAASLQWKLPVDEFSVADGVISHPGGSHAGYGELAAKAAVTPPGELRYKPRARWAHLGHPQARLDTVAKSNGSARYGIDVRLPGMVYAAVRHAPTLGGAPGHADIDTVLKRPGVERVVRLGAIAGSTDAFAVVGRSSWHALQGARALVVEWQARPSGPLDSARILQGLETTARD